MSADSIPSSKTNIFRGMQCLIEVIRSSGEEMWRVDAYQILYYRRGIEEVKRTHPIGSGSMISSTNKTGHYNIICIVKNGIKHP
jgi:hypothetical protein